ncbi:MAG: APC family permease [Humibacter sp.]
MPTTAQQGASEGGLRASLRGSPKGIGLAQGTALYVAAVLGTGILLLPALAAQAAGPGSIVAVAALAVVSIPLAATFAALSTRHPDAGGVATFARRAFGPTAARVVSYWFYFGTPIGAPIAAIMTAQYVVAIIGGDRFTVIAIAAALVIIPVTIAVFGVRFTAWAQLGLSAALMAILVLALAAAAPHTHAANFTPFLPHGAAGVGVAISLYVWAFAGWEAVAGIAGEFSRPRRDIPRATALALVIVAIAYVAIQTAVVGVLGPAAGAGKAPLLDLVAVGLGRGWGIVVACVAVIVVVGVFNAYIAAFSKLGAAMGRDGDLPAWFGHGFERGGIARRGLALSAAVMGVYFVIVVFIPDLQPVILVHTSIAAAIYGMGVASAVILLPRWSVGWWMAAISCVLVLGLLILAGPNLVYPAAVAAGAVLVGAIGRLRRRAPRPSTPRSESTAVGK